MRMHFGVPLALIAAALTDIDAGGEDGRDVGLPVRGGTGDDAGRCRAYLGAILVKANAAAEVRHHLFAEAGIGADDAGLGAIETGLDAGDERGIGTPAKLRVGFDHGLGMHFSSGSGPQLGAASFNDRGTGGVPGLVPRDGYASTRAASVSGLCLDL
ncbi:MAG TPA: hypothetical protein VN710_04405 [Verrucomicrobiae bacterium]|nr:hypothetical protein [Verrucomicrobiae bacterium]